MRNGYIYALSHPETGEVCYIGKTARSLRGRVREHVRAASVGRLPRERWIRSLGSAPAVTVLEVGPFEEWQLNALECEWIRYGKALGWRLVNVTNGGDGGWQGIPKSAEHRRKISEANRRARANATPEERAAWQDWSRGVPRTPEVRAKISTALTGRPGRPWTPEQRARIVAKLQGHPVSEEARRKISEKLKGRELGLERRVAIGNGARGRQTSEETKQKLSAIAKARIALWEYEGSHPLRGRSQSQAHRKKAGEALRRHWADPEKAAATAALISANQNKEPMREHGRLRAHVRWHVERGIVNPKCAYCAEES